MMQVSSEYSHIWQVLGALTEQDTELADIVKNMAGRLGGSRGQDHKFDSKFLLFTGAHVDLENLIRVKIVKNIGDKWDYMIAKLIKFNEEYGHTKVGKKNEAYKDLGEWLAYQRELYYRNLLPQRRYIQLRDLGVAFRGAKSETTTDWMVNYKQLVKYYRKTGTLTPPNVGEWGFLGKWCNKQRWRGNEGLLNLEHKKLLDDLGFDFSCQKEATWKKNLQIYIAEQKRIKKRTFGKNNHSMRAWLKHQIKQFENNKLTAQQVKLLKDAGAIMGEKIA